MESELQDRPKKLYDTIISMAAASAWTTFGILAAGVGLLAYYGGCM